MVSGASDCNFISSSETLFIQRQGHVRGKVAMQLYTIPAMETDAKLL